MASKIKKHIENPIKENKPHELAYIESEDNPNQSQQRTLIKTFKS